MTEQPDNIETLEITPPKFTKGTPPSPSTLRNWDKAGKLRPRRHPMNKYRLYKRIEIENLLKEIEGKK